MAVLVGEQHHHRQTPDDHALEDEEDGPEDDVKRHDAGGAVLALLAALGTRKALKGLVQVIQGHICALEQIIQAFRKIQCHLDDLK